MTPVAVLRRSVWRLPFQRCRFPRIGTRVFAFFQAYDDVVEEDQLGRADDQCGYRDALIQCKRRLRHELGVAHCIVATWHTKEAEVMHRQINCIRSQERDPEM